MDVLTLQDLWNKDTDGYLPVLIEIYNPDIKWTDEEKSAYQQENGYLRVISDYNRVKYKNYIWLPCNFTMTFPETDGTKVGNGTVTITALDARVKRLLKSIRMESDFRIIAMFAKSQKENGKDVYKFVEINSIQLTMSNASKTNTTATFNLKFNNLEQNTPFEVATQDRTKAVNA